MHLSSTRDVVKLLDLSGKPIAAKKPLLYLSFVAIHKIDIIYNSGYC